MIGLFLNKTIARGQIELTRNWFNSMLKIFPDAVVIDNLKNNKLENLLGSNARFIHIALDKDDNWKTFYDKAVEQLKDIDTFICFESLIFKSIGHNKYSALSNFDEKIDNGEYNYSFNYLMTKMFYTKYLTIKAAIDTNKKFVDFIIDPQEPDYTKYFNTGKAAYILNKDDLLYMPSYEYDLLSNIDYIDRDIKVKDFMFYCTALTKDREYIKDANFNIRDSDVHIITCLKDNNYLSQDLYYEKLSYTKYTLIISSYDISTFSIIRFIESLSRGCIPLVLDKCNLNDLENTFPDIYNYVKDNLITSIDNIQNKIDELDYNKTLDDLLSLKSIVDMHNIDYIKSKWNNLLGGR